MRLGTRFGETVGWTLGVAVAPWAFAGSALRNGRAFHPEGELYVAQVEAAGAGPEAELGRRLAGRALVRLSAGLRRGADAHRDVLGLAIRFGWRPGAHESRTQDLLLVTAPSLVQLPLALLRTDTRSHLANDYHAISHFRYDDLTLRIRAVPRRRRSPAGANRAAHLARVVAAGSAVFRLDAQRAGGREWLPFARVRLAAPARGGAAGLLFSPFHAGLGLEPIGFLNGLRRATYPASRAGRAFAAYAVGALLARLGQPLSSAETTPAVARSAPRARRTRRRRTVRATRPTRRRRRAAR